MRAIRATSPKIRTTIPKPTPQTRRPIPLIPTKPIPTNHPRRLRRRAPRDRHARNRSRALHRRQGSRGENQGGARGHGHGADVGEGPDQRGGLGGRGGVRDVEAVAELLD